tara:strand:+ start:458 stop:685 length:228 start_codon:yes stop_codon:yes gene_type:complete
MKFIFALHVVPLSKLYFKAKAELVLSVSILNQNVNIGVVVDLKLNGGDIRSKVLLGNIGDDDSIYKYFPEDVPVL